MNILEYIPFRGDPHGQAVNLCQKNIFALITATWIQWKP